MDGIDFDRLVRAFVGSSSRRRLLGLLTALPLATRLAIPAESPAARARKTRRHRAPRQQRHSPTLRGDEQRREAHGEACIPTGQRCPGRKPRGKHVPKLSCEHCCQGSFTTNATGKRVCGCQPNGGSCSAETASSCCSGYCDGTTCHIPPSAPCGRTCVGCCDASGACQAGSSDSACGTGGAACSDCAGTHPSCVDNTCTACTSSSQCPVNTVCDPSGACLACDVCLSGACDFTSVQAAINAMPARDLIRVCAGTYGGHLTLSRTLTIVGAGEGANPSVDTILQGTGTNIVMTITGGNHDVTLRAVRITGGGGSTTGGGGIFHIGRTLTMTDCTVTGNAAGGQAGGIFIGSTNSTAVLTRCTITSNQAVNAMLGNGGGILTYGQTTLTDCLVAGNTAAAQGGGIWVNGGSLTLSHTRVGGNAPAEANHANGCPTCGGGIYRNAGSVSLTNSSVVCGNVPDQCVGFSDLTHCLATCPP